jgi:queuine/archaeosine tRNA-ribosyltransferase
MVSYADIVQRAAHRRKALEMGLRGYLGVPGQVSIYLDNGAFFFLAKGGKVDRREYEHFVRESRPDWYPIPQDFIPTPRMSRRQQLDCMEQTMRMNAAHADDRTVPVIHVSRHLGEYLQRFKASRALRRKPHVALGGIVPNLLRASKALPYAEVLGNLQRVRHALPGRKLHVFGIGGTATVHVAALLYMDSADSSGWRNRAARGIVQLVGRGDRVVANLGSWRGRAPDAAELKLLSQCACPACRRYELAGLRASGLHGFSNRAAHNLHTVLQEAAEIKKHMLAGTYTDWYRGHVDNSTYRPLIEYLVTQRDRVAGPGEAAA